MRSPSLSSSSSWLVSLTQHDACKFKKHCDSDPLPARSAPANSQTPSVRVPATVCVPRLSGLTPGGGTDTFLVSMPKQRWCLQTRSESGQCSPMATRSTRLSALAFHRPPETQLRSGCGFRAPPQAPLPSDAPDLPGKGSKNVPSRALCPMPL